MEYEILGLKLKLKPDESADAVSPEQVVALVRREALSIKEKNPRLSDGQVATLLALELAKRLISLEKDYQGSLQQFRNQAADVLSSLEQISPSL